MLSAVKDGSLHKACSQLFLRVAPSWREGSSFPAGKEGTSYMKVVGPASVENSKGMVRETSVLLPSSQTPSA